MELLLLNPTILHTLVALGLFLLLLYIFLSRQVFKNSFLREYRKFKAMVEQNQMRLSKITPHALDHFTFLGKDTSGSFGKLNKIIFALSERVAQIDGLIASKKFRSFKYAGDILYSPLQFGESSVHQLLDEEAMTQLPQSMWEGTLEKLFQQVGRGIASASKESDEKSVSERQRKMTFLDLREAGINLPEGDDEEEFLSPM